MSEPLHVENRTVRFQDIDAAGIVFFARIFDYFHDAYAGLMASRGLPLPALLARTDWLVPLVRAEADYQRPLRHGDEVTVAVTAVALGRSSLTVDYLIASGGPCATGRTVHVFVAREGFARLEIPAAVRAAFSAATPSGAE